MPDCLGLFAILKKQSSNIENRIAQPGRGFVCCTRIAQRSITTVNLLYADLFAIPKTGISAPNQLYLSRPFSPYAIREEVCPFNQINQAFSNLQRLDPTPNKESLYLDSDIPRLEALQRFKLSGWIRPYAILQQLRSAITMGCIRGFRALNPLFP